jgi:predicted ATP-binding protein involved in virulence
MEIRRIEYRNVHGFLSGKVTFSQGENFLVGINGTGKTTILNVINWVLAPNFPELCTNYHELIRVDVKHGRYVYSIESKITEGAHELSIATKDQSRNFLPIKTNLIHNPQDYDKSVPNIREHYGRMSPESHEVSAWEFLLNELPAPVFIGLERKINADKSEFSSKSERIKYKNDSLITSQTLMRDAYNTSRHKIAEINDKLNSKVLELSFSGVIHQTSHLTKYSSGDIVLKIKQLKEKFDDTTSQKTYSKALTAPGVRKAIVKFLNDLSALVSNTEINEEDDILIALNQHNFSRASHMFELFNVHEQEIKTAQNEINNFVEAVNSFICDANKEVIFDLDTGTPFFKTPKRKSKFKLSELSSGEAQVVVLMSYFAFLAKKGIPIIIDEPEVSLHVKWQNIFVAAIKKVMPDDCQTIMATHSPEICGAEDVNVQSISAV